MFLAIILLAIIIVLVTVIIARYNFMKKLAFEIENLCKENGKLQYELERINKKYNWSKIIDNNRDSLEKYFYERKIIKIAIYGIGDIGEKLVDILKESEKLEVTQLLDKHRVGYYKGIKIENSSEICKECDIVIISLAANDIETQALLSAKGIKNTIRISEIIEGMI